MSLRMENTHRSNHSIFLPQNFGSPFNDAAEHISGLGLARLDFERCAVAIDVFSRRIIGWRVARSMRDNQLKEEPGESS